MIDDCQRCQQVLKVDGCFQRLFFSFNFNIDLISNLFIHFWQDYKDILRTAFLNEGQKKKKGGGDVNMRKCPMNPEALLIYLKRFRIDWWLVVPGGHQDVRFHVSLTL